MILLDISDGNIQQNELDLGEASKDRSALYGALDRINMRYRRGTLHLASTGLETNSVQWGKRQERRTLRYTTNIDEIPTARS